jgi:DNA helicase-2/ATP-dependent DNA helicase PcrA
MAAHGLNPPQLEAVNTLRGPLLVLAGAGSGKTRVVTFRIAELIKHGIGPSRILAVTFTNKAAGEMQERIGHVIGKRLKEKPQISTFHSFCVKVLRRQIRRLGYPEKFTIYDRGDQEGLARQALREIRVPSEQMRPGDLLSQIGQWKTMCVRPAEAAQKAENDKQHLAAMGYRRYQKALKTAGAVDFDDLLLLTEELFAEHADVRREEANRFDHVLVDEYQDTNGSQYRIVKGLAIGHRNLCVVGDDDQSIYGWRGAEVKHILRFNKDWPDAKVVRLEMNYRSTEAILSTANRLIAFNKHRHDKVLRAARPGGEQPRILQYPDETQEAKVIVEDIHRRLTEPGVEPRDFAVLFRTNEQPRPFEQEFRRLKIQYILLGGQSFFDRKEVKDFLSYFRTLESPDDEPALLRILNTPPRGISSTTIEKLMAQAVSQGSTVWKVMTSGALPPIPAEARGAVERFVAFVQAFQRDLKQGRPLVDMANNLIQKIEYKNYINKQYPDQNEQQTRWASIEEVVNALGVYQRENEHPTLAGFLDEVTLGDRSFDNDKEKQLARNAVALMTYHSSKGLEFRYVYMVGMEEGILPHSRSIVSDSLGPTTDAIDEERRLCYVGITRAQERLTFSMALTRMKWGKPRDTIPSRYLYEFTGQAESPQAQEALKRVAEDFLGKKTTPRGKPKKKTSTKSPPPS